jgi:plasmid stability protein
MKSITITNIPHELYGKIEERAKANNRSVNTEIIACLEHATATGRDPVKIQTTPADILKQAQYIRKHIRAHNQDMLSNTEIRQAINQGRP